MAVGRPIILAHRVAPADHVEPAPARRAFRLEHDPAVNREDPAPMAGAAGEDQKPRFALGARRAEHADARPVGGGVALGPGLHGIERAVNRQRQQEEDEDGEHYTSEGAAHGRERCFSPVHWPAKYGAVMRGATVTKERGSRCRPLALSANAI